MSMSPWLPLPVAIGERTQIAILANVATLATIEDALGVCSVQSAGIWSAVIESAVIEAAVIESAVIESFAEIESARVIWSILCG